MRQKCYDSDLTDSQWEQISRYFTTGRKRSYSLRYHVLDAILYIVKTGTQWRMLPGNLPDGRRSTTIFDGGERKAASCAF